MTTMISPRKTRSGSNRGTSSSNTHINTNIPGPSSLSSSAHSSISAIPKPALKDRPAASLIPIRPASTRQPFRPTVRQASNATVPPGASHSLADGSSRKPLIGLKPPTAVRDGPASRGPSYTLNLKGSALLRQEIQPKAVPAPPSRSPEEDSADESCDEATEDQKDEAEQPAFDRLIEEAIQEPVASSSSQPLTSSSSLGSPSRLSSPFTRRALLSTDDNRPSSSASASTALSDIETDTAASVVSSPDLSDSASEGSSSDRDDEACEDVTSSTRTTRARSRTPVFFGTPSKDEQEQRRRYSRRVRERRVLRRDSLDLARRKTLTLEEVEDAARAFREERAAAEAASDGVARGKAEVEVDTGDVFDERAPSPPLAPVQPQQSSGTEDRPLQNDEVEQQANELEMQKASEPEPHQQTAAATLVDREDRLEADVEAETSLDPFVADDEDSVVSSLEAHPEPTAGEGREQEAEQVEQEATEVELAQTSSLNAPTLEGDHHVVVEGAEDAEAFIRQEDDPATDEQERRSQDLTSQEDELFIGEQETYSQDPSSQEEATEGTVEEATSDEDGVHPLPEALKDITNVPNHKEEDLQSDEAQYEADIPEDDSVANASEETTPEEAGPLELPANQDAVILDFEEHGTDAKSEMVAVDELCVPSSHLYIPDVMDQTLAFDRLEEEVKASTEEENEATVSLTLQEREQEVSPTLESAELPLAPHQGDRTPEEIEEDSSVADVGGLTSRQGTSAEEFAVSGASAETAASADQATGAASEDPLLFTTGDETLAFDVAEGLLTDAALSVDDSMRGTVELSLSRDPEQHEQASVGLGEDSGAEDVHEGTSQPLADQEQPQGPTLAKESSSPTTVVSVHDSTAPATPTPAAHDTSSASFMMDSPGVGLSFRRRYDENVLASAAKRAQQSFALGAHYGQSPADDSLKSLRASPMPLSLSGTPLGERNANISYSRRDIELSPTFKDAGKVKQGVPPLSSRPESPSRGMTEDDLQVSPHMRRLMDVRDAMLMASPTKSPRKPPMRVTMPSPQKVEPVASTAAALASPSREASDSPVKQSSEPSNFEDRAADNAVAIAAAPDVAHLFKKPELSKPEEKDVAAQAPSASSKPPSSAAPVSRLPKLATGNSRIVKPTSVGSLRAPTSIPSARSQTVQSLGAMSSQIARPSVPSHTTNQSTSANPFQKKAAPKGVAPTMTLSRPPSAADSIGSSNSSLNGPSKEKTLKDPRVPASSPAPPASAASTSGPSPVKRTQPISALRKMQGTSQLSSFTHKTADWLKGSAADSNAQWSLGKNVLPSPALARSTGPSSAVPEVESEVSPPAHPSPVKASVMTAGSGRARRVLAGSKEATHAPSEAKATPVVRPRVLMSSTSSARTDSDLEGGARSDAALSSSPDKSARVHADSTPPVMERPLMATYRKPSSSSHGAKSLRVASGSSRKASRTGEAAPSSSSLGPFPPSEISSDSAPSPALDSSGAKEDAEVKGGEIGHRSVSNPLVAAPARTSAAARSASNPAAAAIAPPARASRAKVNDVVPSVPISSAALATLTTRNSRRNEIHLAKLSVVTIRIEGARPPSPSSKIRKSSLAEGAPPMEKGRADEARAVRARKRARESQESRMSAGSEAGERDAERGGVGVWRDPDFRGWETEMVHHRLGAGEEETFSTPLRVKKRVAGKGVRWRKNLFAGPASSSSASASASAPWKSNLVAKDYQLDRHGNARSGDAPPSPSWKRVRVTVRKIVYDDDEEEEYGGGEAASAGVDAWSGTEREGAVSDGEYGGQA